jgi:antitoxin (DNA-binding transcriptional repressor) of toxin-antitoxin stability system
VLIEAVLKGEEVFIVKDGDKIVKLVPVSKKDPTPKFGSAKGMIHMSEDFDAPLDDFRDYMP